jgi:hypothetical protein
LLFVPFFSFEKDAVGDLLFIDRRKEFYKKTKIGNIKRFHQEHDRETQNSLQL